MKIKNKSWMKVLIIIVSFFVFYGFTSYHFFCFAFVRKKRRFPSEKQKKRISEMKVYYKKLREGKNWFEGMPVEKVFIKSGDGLRLVGHFLPAENAERTILCVHGYRSHGKYDFGYIAQFFHENGCNVLLIDHRAHGESQGKYICFGIKERYDCRDWVHYLNNRFGSDLPIVLHGVSMGAATVLMTSGLELPSNVKGIIADCGYTSPWDIIQRVSRKQFHFPDYPLLYIINFMCRKTMGFDLREINSVHALQKNKIPVLFIHGDGDTFVPSEMTQINYEVCRSKKRLELVKDAGHAMSYLTKTKYYQRLILKFVSKI